MVRRRLAFATPFVVVVGCKAPPPVEPGEDDRTRDEEAPVVVTLARGTDASVAPSPAVAILGEGDPPVPAIRAVVLERSDAGYSGSLVTFNAGTDRGVTVSRASAWLLKADTDEPMGGGLIEILDCRPDRCRGMVRMRPEAITGHPNVEISFKDPAKEATLAQVRPPDRCCTNPPPPRPPPPPPDQVPTANPPRPLRARIIATQVEGETTGITIAAGTAAGVDPKRSEVWVVRGETTMPLAGGLVTLRSCTPRSCKGTVKLTLDQVRANPAVSVRRKD